jgi:formamidopyrimidine-DNA glycosylase
MPELPDVETYRRYLKATALHQEIAKVHVEDARLLAGITAQALGRALVGHRFERSRRHGKILFAELDSGRWLVLHFGMSGSLAYCKHAADCPRYTQVLIEFAKGCGLAYVAPRKLGYVTLTNGVQEFVERRQLGVDALALDLAELAALAKGYRGSLKSLLLDQPTIAGIGNIYGDEILFRARLHPQRAVSGLSQRELRRLQGALHAVLARAIAARADSARMPRKWLLPRRQANARCPRCGTPLRHASIAGRRSYLCPHCQPRQ